MKSHRMIVSAVMAALAVALLLGVTVIVSSPAEASLATTHQCAALKSRHRVHVDHSGSFVGKVYTGMYRGKSAFCMQFTRTRGRRFTAHLTETAVIKGTRKVIASKTFRNVNHVSELRSMFPYKAYKIRFYAARPSSRVLPFRFDEYQPGN